MRIFLLLLLALFAFGDELDDIESIIKTSKVELKEAKKEQNIKKLAEIAQKLYDNHQKIKKLKPKSGSSDAITLRCNGDICKEPTLQVGDKVKVTFNLFFEDSEEYEKSTFIWQLQHNKKVIKNSSEEIYEKGGSKKFDFDIGIDDSFADGKYRIAMQHRNSSSKVKSDALFFVKKPLSVREVIVSTDKEAKKSDADVYADENIYILSGFTLANSKKKINIDVKLVDTTKGETLIESSFVRPKEGEEKKKNRLRFKIPASKLYANQKLSFEMRLYADDINEIVKSTKINVKDYKLLVRTPSSLMSANIARYSITPPKSFVEPLKVDINPSGGILLAHKTKLSGTIEAINKNNEKASISVIITDANGKTVSSTVSINLTTKYVEDKSVKQASTPTAPKYGDTRENSDGAGGTVYQKYNGSEWITTKMTTYYSNGKMATLHDDFDDKGNPRIYKVWRKNGNKQEFIESSKDGSFIERTWYKSGNIQKKLIGDSSGDISKYSYYKNGNIDTAFRLEYSNSGASYLENYENGHKRSKINLIGFDVLNEIQEGNSQCFACVHVNFHDLCKRTGYSKTCESKEWSENGKLSNRTAYSMDEKIVERYENGSIYDRTVIKSSGEYQVTSYDDYGHIKSLHKYDRNNREIK